jgi:hypothetical protein
MHWQTQVLVPLHAIPVAFTTIGECFAIFITIADIANSSSCPFACNSCSLHNNRRMFRNIHHNSRHRHLGSRDVYIAYHASRTHPGIQTICVPYLERIDQIYHPGDFFVFELESRGLFGRISSAYSSCVREQGFHQDLCPLDLCCGIVELRVQCVCCDKIWHLGRPTRIGNLKIQKCFEINRNTFIFIFNLE